MGVNIHYEVAGQGVPLLFAHEFAGDVTSWEPQVNLLREAVSGYYVLPPGVPAVGGAGRTRRRTRRTGWSRICGDCWSTWG